MPHHNRKRRCVDGVMRNLSARPALAHTPTLWVPVCDSLGNRARCDPNSARPTIAIPESNRDQSARPRKRTAEPERDCRSFGGEMGTLLGFLRRHNILRTLAALFLFANDSNSLNL